ncbi:MAG: putative toxin-antitoxin system toxin component, PIN family [Pseudomonadota bacterium]
MAVTLSRDPKDDRFLEVALNGDADLLITGDQDLLVLHPFQSTTIITPAEFLSRYT